MDNIFSYWPLLFLIFVIIGRIMRYLNKKNKQKIRQNTDNIDNIKEVTEQSRKADTEPKEEYDTFSYDRDDEIETITDEKTEEYLEIEKEAEKREEKSIKKPQVEKLKGGGKVKLFKKKEDIIRGIIMKEVLDQPHYKKKSSK